MKNALKMLICLTVICESLCAQMKVPDPTVFIYAEDSMYAMKASASQTELKRRRKVQGVNVGKRTRRRFWGAHAPLITDAQPKFAISPKKRNLNDCAILRLKSPREARYLPDADFNKCRFVRIELGLFRIESLPDFGFAVTPAAPLVAGGYILFDLTQGPVNECGDFKAYDFCVAE